MDEHPMDTIRLDNGLTLELHDRSRNLAGDRWLVTFQARIEIEVKPDWFAGRPDSGPSYEDIRAALGDRTVYTYEKTRNFIDKGQRVEVFEALKTRFLENSLSYLSSPDFPRRLLLRKYLQPKGYTTVWRRI
ncbi:MAG: hypothetical protein KKB20_14225 [Proteobacteria bacterium]|nr:hypothetical protein [Pseudomonadota bacterium]